MLRRLKGQSTLEYAITIAVVVAALLAMQIYMKRALQGRLRQSTDDIGEQYSAGKTTSKFIIEQMGDLKTKEEFGIAGEGVSRYEITQSAKTKRTATGGDAEKVTEGLSSESLF